MAKRVFDFSYGASEPVEYPEYSAKRIDFRAIWPDDGHWNVDNKIPAGTFEIRNKKWYASAETIIHFADMAEHLMPEKSEPKTKRAEILDEAKSLTTSSRNTQYGEPIDHLSHVAGILNAYGYRGPEGRLLKAHDVPVFQIIVKLSRLGNDPIKMDSWVDVAGYASIGGEVADIEAAKND